MAHLTDATIYPNPTGSEINVQLGSFSDDATVDLYSATGQLLLSQKIGPSSFTLNITGLAHGMYYISIKNGGSIMMRPIIKE